MINKAFVTKVTTPELPTGYGAGSDGPPFVEVQSETLVTSFAIESDGQAQIVNVGDYALSKLKVAFTGRTMNGSTSDISHIGSYQGSNEIMKTIHQVGTEYYQTHTYEYQKGEFQTVEIISNSQRPEGSTRTYTWEVFGYDRDKTGEFFIWHRHSEKGWDPIRVQTGTSGDVRILADGYGGTAQQGLIWTDHNKKNLETSKIAIEMHSKDMHIGVRLTIENDVGQKDTLIIPAFLNTE